MTTDIVDLVRPCVWCADIKKLHSDRQNVWILLC